MKKTKEKELKWYNSGHKITSAVIAVILLIIICSQSFANGEFTFELFSSVINHNSIYLFALIYFILLKFSVGKRYFNYLNVFLVFIYFIVMVTSGLTVFQSFSLNTVLNFILNFVLFIYLSHTLFRDTRIWKEFHLGKSPFNELTNDWIYYAIIVLTVFLLAVNLISTVVLRGVIISLLDAVYMLLFGRYIYLYRDYLDHKQLDASNEGNFDEIRGKVQEVLDKTEIDDKIVDGVKDMKEKIDTFVEEKEIDKKIDSVKEKVFDTSSAIKDTIQDTLSTNEKKTVKKSDKKSTTRKTTKKGDDK